MSTYNLIPGLCNIETQITLQYLTKCRRFFTFYLSTISAFYLKITSTLYQQSKKQYTGQIERCWFALCYNYTEIKQKTKKNVFILNTSCARNFVWVLIKVIFQSLRGRNFTAWKVFVVLFCTTSTHCPHP